MRNKGFTLVELMVVVAIIIILAAILVPRYLDVTDQAKASKCVANQRTLEGSASVYMADNNGTMPAGLSDLVGQYVQVVPDCPGEGGAYSYDPATGAVTCSSHTRDY
jgi:general secretion pathway protein G